MYILDTDVIAHDQNEHPILSAKVRSTPGKQLFITSVTLDEQFRGRLAYINRHRNNLHKSPQGHAAVVQTVYYSSKWNMLAYDEDADTTFHRLKRQHIRIGSHDLHIAPIAFLHHFTVVTHKIRDFAEVLDLEVEDWTGASQ